MNQTWEVICNVRVEGLVGKGRGFGQGDQGAA